MVTDRSRTHRGVELFRSGALHPPSAPWTDNDDDTQSVVEFHDYAHGVSHLDFISDPMIAPVICTAYHQCPIEADTAAVSSSLAPLPPQPAPAAVILYEVQTIVVSHPAPALAHTPWTQNGSYLNAFDMIGRRAAFTAFSLPPSLSHRPRRTHGLVALYYDHFDDVLSPISLRLCAVWGVSTRRCRLEMRTIVRDAVRGSRRLFACHVLSCILAAVTAMFIIAAAWRYAFAVGPSAFDVWAASFSRSDDLVGIDAPVTSESPTWASAPGRVYEFIVSAVTPVGDMFGAAADSPANPVQPGGPSPSAPRGAAEATPATSVAHGALRGWARESRAAHRWWGGPLLAHVPPFSGALDGHADVDVMCDGRHGVFYGPDPPTLPPHAHAAAPDAAGAGSGAGVSAYRSTRLQAALRAKHAHATLSAAVGGGSTLLPWAMPSTDLLALAYADRVAAAAAATAAVGGESAAGGADFLADPPAAPDLRPLGRPPPGGAAATPAAGPLPPALPARIFVTVPPALLLAPLAVRRFVPEGGVDSLYLGAVRSNASRPADPRCAHLAMNAYATCPRGHIRRAVYVTGRPIPQPCDGSPTTAAPCGAPHHGNLSAAPDVWPDPPSRTSTPAASPTAPPTSAFKAVPLRLPFAPTFGGTATMPIVAPNGALPLAAIRSPAGPGRDLHALDDAAHDTSPAGVRRGKAAERALDGRHVDVDDDELAPLPASVADGDHVLFDDTDDATLDAQDVSPVASDAPTAPAAGAAQPPAPKLPLLPTTCALDGVVVGAPLAVDFVVIIDDIAAAGAAAAFARVLDSSYVARAPQARRTTPAQTSPPAAAAAGPVPPQPPGPARVAEAPAAHVFQTYTAAGPALGARLAGQSPTPTPPFESATGQTTHPAGPRSATSVAVAPPSPLPRPADAPLAPGLTTWRLTAHAPRAAPFVANGVAQQVAYAEAMAVAQRFNASAVALGMRVAYNCTAVATLAPPPGVAASLVLGLIGPLSAAVARVTAPRVPQAPYAPDEAPPGVATPTRWAAMDRLVRAAVGPIAVDGAATAVPPLRSRALRALAARRVPPQSPPAGRWALDASPSVNGRLGPVGTRPLWDRCNAFANHSEIGSGDDDTSRSRYGGARRASGVSADVEAAVLPPYGRCADVCSECEGDNDAIIAVGSDGDDSVTRSGGLRARAAAVHDESADPAGIPAAACGADARDFVLSALIISLPTVAAPALGHAPAEADAALRGILHMRLPAVGVSVSYAAALGDKFAGWRGTDGPSLRAEDDGIVDNGKDDLASSIIPSGYALRGTFPTVCYRYISGVDLDALLAESSDEAQPAPHPAGSPSPPASARLAVVGDAGDDAGASLRSERPSATVGGVMGAATIPADGMAGGSLLQTAVDLVPRSTAEGLPWAARMRHATPLSVSLALADAWLAAASAAAAPLSVADGVGWGGLGSGIVIASGAVGRRGLRVVSGTAPSANSSSTVCLGAWDRCVQTAPFAIWHAKALRAVDPEDVARAAPAAADVGAPEPAAKPATRRAHATAAQRPAAATGADADMSPFTAVVAASGYVPLSGIDAPTQSRCLVVGAVRRIIFPPWGRDGAARRATADMARDGEPSGAIAPSISDTSSGGAVAHPSPPFVSAAAGVCDRCAPIVTWGGPTQHHVPYGSHTYRVDPYARSPSLLPRTAVDGTGRSEESPATAHGATAAWAAGAAVPPETLPPDVLRKALQQTEFVRALLLRLGGGLGKVLPWDSDAGFYPVTPPPSYTVIPTHADVAAPRAAAGGRVAGAASDAPEAAGVVDGMMQLSVVPRESPADDGLFQWPLVYDHPAAADVATIASPARTAVTRSSGGGGDALPLWRPPLRSFGFVRVAVALPWVAPQAPADSSARCGSSSRCGEEIGCRGVACGAATGATAGTTGCSSANESRLGGPSVRAERAALTAEWVEVPRAVVASSGFAWVPPPAVAATASLRAPLHTRVRVCETGQVLHVPPSHPLFRIFHPDGVPAGAPFDAAGVSRGTVWEGRSILPVCRDDRNAAAAHLAAVYPTDAFATGLRGNIYGTASAALLASEAADGAVSITSHAVDLLAAVADQYLSVEHAAKGTPHVELMLTPSRVVLPRTFGLSDRLPPSFEIPTSAITVSGSIFLVMIIFPFLRILWVIMRDAVDDIRPDYAYFESPFVDDGATTSTRPVTTCEAVKKSTGPMCSLVEPRGYQTLREIFDS